MTTIIGIIPARWGSTRFEGKILADLCGRPVVQHVWERARQSRMLQEVVIACDDERIAAAAKGFGARVIMTSPDHPSGTDRIVEALGSAPADIVVNIQGDEPLIRPDVIDLLAGALAQDSGAAMATLITPIVRREDAADPNIVKVVVNVRNEAMYFSRAPIPFDRDGAGFRPGLYHKHLGVYAYRRSLLERWPQLPPSVLEQTERLEQLRVLAAGEVITTVLTDMVSIGVDTPQDLARAEALMQENENGKK